MDANGKPVYGEVFRPGKGQDFEVNSDLKELYLVVCATPTNILDVPMTGDFRSFEQEPFPYKVKLAGCEPLDVLVTDKAKAPAGAACQRRRFCGKHRAGGCHRLRRAGRPGAGHREGVRKCPDRGLRGGAQMPR